MVVTEEEKYLCHTIEHSKAKSYTAERELFANIFFTCIAKYLKDNNHNSFYFVQKHTCVLVLGHYLFLKAHSFSHLGIDNVCEEIFLNIFMPNRGYCWDIYIYIYIYINCRDMLRQITCEQIYFKDYKDDCVRMVWLQSNSNYLTDLSNFLTLKVLLFFHMVNFNNELVSYSCTIMYNLIKIR